jgi:malonyl-CoA decarboxylase
LKHFATLSPIPGFGRWLAGRRLPDTASFDADTSAALAALDDPDWPETAAAARLRPILLRLCARYLIEEKQDDAAHDPVARFHLRNGARLERINLLGDRSPKGLHESAGLMVNYVYDPATIVANHEAYVRDHKVVASRAVRSLL